jgi:hypothetical protein
MPNVPATVVHRRVPSTTVPTDCISRFNTQSGLASMLNFGDGTNFTLLPVPMPGGFTQDDFLMLLDLTEIPAVFAGCSVETTIVRSQEDDSVMRADSPATTTSGAIPSTTVVAE